MLDLKNRWEVAPSSISHKRSTFDITYKHKTTMNFGKLVPFMVQEVLPGDTYTFNTQMLSRMSTPLYPVMDNSFMDYAFFFVPNRLVYDHWAEFLGENKDSAWVSDIEYIIPHRKVVSRPGSVYDHMGIPTYDENAISQYAYEGISAPPALDVMAIPLRDYHLIWNEWYRSEAVQDPIIVNTGDDFTEEEAERFQTLVNVCKPFDYFTAGLPAPQKGDGVDIPLGNWAPVYTRAENVPGAYSAISSPLRFFTNGVAPAESYLRIGHSGNAPEASRQFASLGSASTLQDSNDVAIASRDVTGLSGTANLWADLSTASTITVNALRQSFMMQRLLELQARSGTRYTEIIRASFGVISPDARLQRPEYLGGCRLHLQMQQVTQVAPQAGDSPLGRVGAYSKTISANRDFTASMTEHGFIIGVVCARTDHTFQQGLEPFWSRRGRFDFYWETFAHLPEQPIYNKQLYATGNDEIDNTVFCYQEAWADYRYKPAQVTGAFRSTVGTNLDEWHYADHYVAPPILSASWLEETAVNVDRTLAVQSSLHDQLLVDIQVNMIATRPMPLYSIPGLGERF